MLFFLSVQLVLYSPLLLIFYFFLFLFFTFLNLILATEMRTLIDESFDIFPEQFLSVLFSTFPSCLLFLFCQFCFVFCLFFLSRFCLVLADSDRQRNSLNLI